MTKKLLAFHSDPAIKQEYLERLELHRQHDEIVKGIYWENGKGCAVGCTIHGNDHCAYEKELGISRILAHLEDGIFEGLPNVIAKDFPIRFLSAINVGADLGIVFYKFMHWLLVDKDEGIIKFVKLEESIKTIQDIANLFDRQINGENIEYNVWQEVRSAANAAYTNAANAAAVHAVHAADAAADAHAAAYAAAAYAAYAKQTARIKQADKLIELLSSCPGIENV